MAVEIRKSVIEAQIEAGMKKKELAEYYGLPMLQMTKVLQQLGLRIKQNHLPKFVIVDDTVEEEIHVINSEDMKMNPELADHGVAIGDVVTLGEPVTNVAGEGEW